jgi:excisionase family DNA binding protein
MSTAVLSSDLLTREQVAEILGIKPQTVSVWHCTHRYGFHRLAIRVGARVRYRRSDLDAWLASRTVGASAQNQ